MKKPVTLAAAIALSGLCAIGGARAGAVDFSFGWISAEGKYGGDREITLTQAPLELYMGGDGNRFTMFISWSRINPTGNVTWSAQGPIVMSINSPTGLPFQTSGVGKSESGFGDIILEDETTLVKSGRGKRPDVTWVVGLKAPTADHKNGLGTGKTDWWMGLTYTQPLGKSVQFLADVEYVFMGSPVGLNFDDRIGLRGGFAVIFQKSTWTATYTSVTPPLDLVMAYDTAGTPLGLVEVEDMRIASLEILGRSKNGGSIGLGVGWGLNDSSQDIGFMLKLSTAPR